MRAPTLHLAAAALLCVGLLAGATAAQSSSDRAAAQALFDEARQLRDEGRNEQACAKFALSHRLSPRVGTQFNLADCYELTGRFGHGAKNILEGIACFECVIQLALTIRSVQIPLSVIPLFRVCRRVGSRSTGSCDAIASRHPKRSTRSPQASLFPVSRRGHAGVYPWRIVPVR